MATYPVLQITEGEWKSRRYYDILGLQIPTFLTSDPALWADYISSFQTREDDVFVVTYPKSVVTMQLLGLTFILYVPKLSAAGNGFWENTKNDTDVFLRYRYCDAIELTGTTWVTEIVWQIYNNGQISGESILYRVPFLEMATHKHFLRNDLKTLPSPRLIKSHLPYSIIPKSSDMNTQCKYIYIVRNPKDVAVSFFHFEESRKAYDDEYNGPWEFFSKLFMNGNAGWCSWTDHVLDWWQHKDDANVLFLKYEDLLKDLPSHVRMIAKFLNKPLSDELIGRIAEQCTFKGMTKNLASFEITVDGLPPGRKLRKGIVGDWKNYFTPELNERFEEEMLGKLKGSGLEFDFEI